MPEGISSLPESPQPILDSLVAAFESEWIGALQGHDPPSLTPYLDRVDGEPRVVLREQLLLLDCQYRPRWLKSRVAADTVHSAKETPQCSVEQTSTGVGVADTVPPTEAAAAARQDHGTPDASPQETVDHVPRPPLASSAQRNSALNVRVPGYEILDELGRGGMGIVYRARQEGLNRLVALKMIRAGEHASADLIERFRAEAEAVAKFQHPHIVQIHEVGELRGLPYFSLEYVDGEPLSQECRGVPVMPERAAELLETVARAMHYAHGHGILHRDLKPANILMTRDGVPKISDFGLVKQLETDGGQTSTGAVLGTPSFMPPEQARGEPQLTTLADVYSLGAVLYNLLTGRPPFLSATMVDTVIQVLNEDPVPPSRLQPTTPQDLETICLKCLQKEPANRYASAEDLAEDLRRFRTGEPIHARPVGISERVWRWCRRNPRIAATSALAGLLALVLMIGGPIASAVIYQQKQLAVEAGDQATISEQNAVKARNAAVAAEQQAVKDRELAKDNERKAIESRKVAETQSRLALESLRTLVSDVQEQLENKPQLQPLRRSLLQTALTGLDKVAAQGVDVNIKEIAMAGAYRRMGDVYLELGQTDKALQQYQQCHAIIEHLARNNALPNAHHNLSFSQTNMGDTALRAGNLSLAKTCYLQALAIRREWVTAEPENDMVPQNVAESLGKLGNVCLTLGQIPEAQTYFEESLALREEWLNRAPDNIGAQQQVAGAENAMGKISLNRGHLDDAEQYSQAALAAITRLLDQQPDNRSHRWNTALFSSQLGAVQLMAGKADAAVEHYQHALNLLEPLSQQDPQNARLRRHLAEAHYGIAAAYTQLGNPAAGEHHQTALSLRQRLVEDDPTSAEEQVGLMLSLAQCGQHAEASQIGQTLRASRANDAYVLYKTAAGFALCASAATRQQAADGTTPTAAELAERYATASVETLQTAITNGFQLTAEAAVDPDFEQLRGREDFRELLEQVQ